MSLSQAFVFSFVGSSRAINCYGRGRGIRTKRKNKKRTASRKRSSPQAQYPSRAHSATPRTPRSEDVSEKCPHSFRHRELLFPAQVHRLRRPLVVVVAATVCRGAACSSPGCIKANRIAAASPKQAPNDGELTVPLEFSRCSFAVCDV